MSRPVARTIALCLWAASSLAGCDDGAPAASAADGARPDAALDVGVAADAAPVDARPAEDALAPDLGHPDATVDGAVDAAPVDGSPPDGPLRCSAPTEGLAPTGPLPPAASPHRGIDAWEQASWARLRAHLMGEADVHFAATYDHATDRLRIDGGPLEARATVEVARTADGLQVVAGDLAAIFPNTDPATLSDWAALSAAYEAIPDEAHGWLPRAVHAWPHPLPRLWTLFDAPDAPDAVYGLWPSAQANVGTHGGMGLLQSRATFILSGAGVRSGVVLDETPILPDVVPTALAALGAPTTGGVGPDGVYADGLHLRWQDGWPRWEALDPDPCVRAKHVVLVLFDGLMASEINRLVLTDDAPVDLPTFRALARDGVVYASGATVGFPSFSAPGHTTAGTGLWPGHHGVVGNAFWGRAERALVNPFSILADPTAVLADPASLWTLYDRMINDGVETLAQATHRALGAYDPATGEGAFTAVFNEVALGGADWTTLDHFGVGADKADPSQARIADQLAVVQATALLRDTDRPVPTTLQLAFVATDGAGERSGPHSPELQETLVTLDGQLARLRQLYADRGALDDTLFILVSDHGMARQRPGATGTAGVATRAGVPVRYIGNGAIWLATAELAATREGDTVAVVARAHDDGAPLVDATVTCEGCVAEGEPAAQTDAEGRTAWTAPGAAVFRVSAAGYPDAELAVPAP